MPELKPHKTMVFLPTVAWERHFVYPLLEGTVSWSRKGACLAVLIPNQAEQALPPLRIARRGVNGSWGEGEV